MSGHVIDDVQQIDSLNHKFNISGELLTNKLVGIDFDRATEFISEAQLYRHNKTKQSRIQKCEHLVAKCTPGRADLDTNWCSNRSTLKKEDLDRSVKNHSDQVLTDAEVPVLAEVNFAVTPTQIPVVDVTIMETAIHNAKLEQGQAETL